MREPPPTQKSHYRTATPHALLGRSKERFLSSMSEYGMEASRQLRETPAHRGTLVPAATLIVMPAAATLMPVALLLSE
jgi:hypothetical protein|eukprot:SAG25_NODE_153_length_13583_cov_199.837659_2_plen_78_part_00